MYNVKTTARERERQANTERAPFTERASVEGKGVGGNSRQKVASPFSSKTRVERNENEMMEMEWNVSLSHN